MNEFHRLCLLKKKRNKSGLGGEQAMSEFVKLQEFALATSVTKRRSGAVFVRLKMVRTCQANTVCELNMKWKAKEEFKVYIGGW